MMKNLIYSRGGFAPLAVLLVVLVLIVGGGTLLASKISPGGYGGDKTENGSLVDVNEKVVSGDSENNAMPVQGETINGGSDTEVFDAEVASFSVVAKNYSFDTKEIKVKRGASVKINLKVGEGFHDLVIDEFNVRTPQMRAENSAEVAFVADKIGVFEYYCSVGQHRQMGMVGKFIVE